MTKKPLSVAMVAHDAKKELMKIWAQDHLSALKSHQIFATGTTAGVLASIGNMLNVTALQSGPLGGDQQLGAMICEGRLDALIFFQDPMTAQPHDVDVKALIRMSTLYDVPLACNKATADMLIESRLFA